MITIDDLLDDTRMSGFKNVRCWLDRRPGRRNPRPYAARFDTWDEQNKCSVVAFQGPPRATPEEAARDAVDYLNGNEQPTNDLVVAARKARKIRARFATQAEYDAFLEERARPLTRKPPTGKNGKGKVNRSPQIRAGAINRAFDEELQEYVCESTGVAFRYGLHVHHVRDERDCIPLGILWDSMQNVLAITPNEHARAHFSPDDRASLYAIMDAKNVAQRRTAAMVERCEVA